MTGDIGAYQNHRAVEKTMRALYEDAVERRDFWSAAAYGHSIWRRDLQAKMELDHAAKTYDRRQ